jgi:drug/metabolite transporter (DMT)-like permease
MPPDPKARLLLAFAAVYVIWGSTYLAILWAIQTIPPFTMAGARFLVAGGLMYAWARLRGAPNPSAAEWRAAFVIGTLLLLGGNGGVVWAETRVPSGLAALFVGAEPLWAVLLDWARPGGTRPRALVIAGLLVGFGGVALLAAPGTAAGTDLLGIAALLAATISWAAGSIYSRHATVPANPLMSTGIKMLTGGLVLAAVGAAAGELSGFDIATVSAKSALAWSYLVVFGAIAAFSAYMYLLAHTTIAKASTYAYVNPIVALLLGWGLAGEALTARTWLAAGVIIGGVALINSAQFAVAGRLLLARGGPTLRTAGAGSAPEPPTSDL